MQRQARRTGRPVLWGLAIGTVVVGAFAVWWFLTPDLDPDEYGVRIERFTLESEMVGQQLDEVAVLPPGETEDRPVLLFLHGRGSSPEGMLSNEMFEALREADGDAPVVVLANGGDASYFHDRVDGAWGSYILEELLPEAADRWSLDDSRVAIGGVSMGGFGALDQARLHPGRFCAVGGHSPAVFTNGANTTEGSFDDAEDFAAHDVYAAVQQDPDVFEDTPVWIDVGDEDPFREADEQLGKRLEEATAEARFTVWPGGHDEGYWWSHMNDYIDFYVDALANCG